jgi:magnesium transporter
MDNIENEIFLKNTNHTSQIRRLYKLKRKSGLNSRVLVISTDAIDKFKLLNLQDSEIVDLKDKHKDVVADFDHLNTDHQPYFYVFGFLIRKPTR